VIGYVTIGQKKEKATGKRIQVKVTPEAITMWFKRHPDVRRKLKLEIVEEELSKDTISETVFENGFFKELPSIKNWILELSGREAKEETIRSFVNDIKRVCKGEIRKKGTKREYEIIDGWGLKHPDGLTLEDALTYISELRKRGHKTRQYRLSLRNFLQSRNVKGWFKISGATEETGKYAHLYISKEKIYAIFDWLKQVNYQAYLASKFAYKCGGVRITATLTVHAKRINFEDHTIRVVEKATKGKPKRIQEKLIPHDFWDEIPKEGKLFDIKPQELNNLLRTAYKEIIPELVEEIPQPFHFWRHQFAQHMLREAGWNYGLVARLGHWTVATLERYYGKMDRKTAFECGIKCLTKI
jgi:integrase